MDKFTIEYKKKCFEVLQFSQNIELIMKALEEQDSLTFRFQIEIVLDKIKENLEPREILDNGGGDLLLWNGIVKHYYEVQEVYTEFMDKYIQEIDLTQKEVINDKK